MKKLSGFISAGCAILVFVVCAYSKQPAKGAGLSVVPEAFSVDQARNYFEQVAMPSRAGEQGALTLGAYTVDWSRAEFSSGKERVAVFYRP